MDRDYKPIPRIGGKIAEDGVTEVVEGEGKKPQNPLLRLVATGRKKPDSRKISVETDVDGKVEKFEW